MEFRISGCNQSAGTAKQLTNWTEQQIFSFAWSRDGKRIIARAVHAKTTLF
jgi:hypothetical protein